MELLTGERYAIGDIFIHNQYDWEIHFEQTWEDMYPEDYVIIWLEMKKNMLDCGIAWFVIMFCKFQDRWMLSI